MNEKVKKVTTVVKEKWTGFSKPVKIMLAAIPVVIIVIIIIAVNIANNRPGGTLYSGLNSDEATEILSVLNSMGVSDVRMTSDGDIIVPESRIEDLRMELAVQGYPKNSTDYDIWNDGVDLWSTDSDKREVMRQQREARIAGTLAKLEPVSQATVILDIPKTPNYVITNKDEVPRCSVTLKLRGTSELKYSEVRAIYRIVLNSVEGLTLENISVVDTIGREYPYLSEEEEKSGEVDATGVPTARRRFEFQRDFTQALKSQLDQMMTTIWGAKGYALSVAADLNYDAKRIESVEYIPVEGTNTGVAQHEDHVTEYIGEIGPEGIVGVTPGADHSPDYPTLNGVGDGETYYYKKDEIQYDVTNIKTTVEKNGYEIKTLSVGLAINSEAMSETDLERIRNMVAKAAGTDASNVAVYNTVFTVGSIGSGTTVGDGLTGIWTTERDPNRDMMLYIVIALGVILVLLLIASLFMSRSRKRKIKKRQEQAIVAAQLAVADGGSGYMFTSDGEMPKEVDFNIASLTEEAGKDSRETILKREIADFAKTNPDIVANIIKNMLRDES